MTQLRKGIAEYAVLLALRRRESYGYEILQELLHVRRLELSESTIYPLLNRLSSDGLLAVRRVSSPAGPPRRYYRLTAAGIRRLDDMDGCWDDIVQSIRQMREGTSHA